MARKKAWVSNSMLAAQPQARASFQLLKRRTFGLCTGMFCTPHNLVSAACQQQTWSACGLALPMSCLWSVARASTSGLPAPCCCQK